MGCIRKVNCNYYSKQTSCNVNCHGYVWDSATSIEPLIISDMSDTSSAYFRYQTSKLAEMHLPHEQMITTPATYLPERGIIFKKPSMQLFDYEGRRMNRSKRREEIKNNKRKAPLSVEEKRKLLRKKRKKNK